MIVGFPGAVIIDEDEFAGKTILCGTQRNQITKTIIQSATAITLNADLWCTLFENLDFTLFLSSLKELVARGETHHHYWIQQSAES